MPLTNCGDKHCDSELVKAQAGLLFEQGSLSFSADTEYVVSGD
jgi:hypothetical protein